MARVIDLAVVRYQRMPDYQADEALTVAIIAARNLTECGASKAEIRAALLEAMGLLDGTHQPPY